MDVVSGHFQPLLRLSLKFMTQEYAPMSFQIILYQNMLVKRILEFWAVIKFNHRTGYIVVEYANAYLSFDHVLQFSRAPVSIIGKAFNLNF